MTAELRIDSAGPLVTLQDGGRPGLMRFGVPASGAMDRLALAAANLALGNPAGTAVIEVSLGGLALGCTAGPVRFAVAGGGFIVEHAGQRGGSWQVGTLNAGERLVIRPGRWGSWCCLALAGGIEAPLWLGARATHSQSGLGGGAIRAGQRLRIRASAPSPGLPDGPFPCPVLARPRAGIAVVPGPQDRFFSADSLARFLAAIWRITSAGDRMGIRLAGPRIAPAAALDMPSEPVLRGSVQVAGDGVPAVLMADHQTTGGYPKIATVLDADLDALAQLRPNAPLRFHAVTPEEAVQRARSHAGAVGRYLAALGARAAPEGRERQ